MSSALGVGPRTTERAAILQTYASDPKYKKYAQQVEKCLNSFDNVQEWADCIAFLKQMLKTFQSYMQFKEIPRKLIVAKRLAQCLNPALPTGVHQRALDVYRHILSVSGSEGLRRDLALWSSGLFPFFEYAATSVKPTLLDLFDTHYLPLQSSLRPAMKAFILALLPGLEEETSEFFDRVLTLLDRLVATVSQSFFLQNIWLIMLTTPSARGTALNFLARRLPRLNADDDVASIVGRDIGLMVRAFAAALEDDNLLVRRAVLDILLQSMRMDSAVVRQVRAEDRTILMRAATGVVLRRDISLNRRLYTWLLGPEDKSEAQIGYLQKHALELLKTTLRDEMFSPSAEYSESRPFKIFISLLDKWEIGVPLTSVLVYDAFKAVKDFVESHSESNEDMLITANTLYEAVEPHLIWKDLLIAISNDISGDGEPCDGIRMAFFVLRNLRARDDEIEQIHLPTCFAAIADLLTAQVQREPQTVHREAMYRSLELLEEIFHHMQPICLMERPELNAEAQVSVSSHSPYAFACIFYGIKPVLDIPKLARDDLVPFVSVLENITSLSNHFMQILLGVSECPSIVREGFSRVLLIMSKLVGQLNSSVSVSWDPDRWLTDVLSVLETEKSDFVTLDRIVTLALALNQAQALEPRPSIEGRPVMRRMVTKLLWYLRSECSVYHIRTVNLIWLLENTTHRPHVESILAQSMTSSSHLPCHDPFEAFGVLWRLTEDSSLPGFHFKVPLMIVLDALKADEPSLRRNAETWMRCSMKSYPRVLDPILFDLLNPAIRRTATSVSLMGKELEGFSYDCPFDERYISHLLEALLSVVKFGGPSLSRIARTTPIRRSHHLGLTVRLEVFGIVDTEASYLDVLVDLLLRFLQTEPLPTLALSMGPINVKIQSTSVDLLQLIVARGELEDVALKIIEVAVLQKLYLCVHRARLDLQNKLLHLLHSLVSASLSYQDIPPIKSSSKRHGDGMLEEKDSPHGPEDISYTVSPLMVQTLVDGVAVSTNRPVLQHWLDFILLAIPQLPRSAHGVVVPLNDCLCKQLRAGLLDFLQSSQRNDAEIPCVITDAELIALLNALERLTLLSLASTSNSDQIEDSVTEKSGTETSGLLGYVSNVFSSDNVQNLDEEPLTARSSGYRVLHDSVLVLYAIWTTLVWSKPALWSPKDDSLSMIYNRTRARCRRVLEHFFRVHPAEVFESVVDCWNRELESGATRGDVFELVDVLVANATTAVHMMCESIMCRLTGISERNKKQAINPNLSEAILFEFLERYLQRLEGPLALQVWGRFLLLVKDIGSISRDVRMQNFPLLRCITVLAEKITHTTAKEDRRIRRELQENIGKLLDACLSHVGRSLDQGTWIRRGTQKEALPTNGRDSPVPSSDPKLKIDEKLNSSSISLPEAPKGSSPSDYSVQFVRFLARSVLPNLRSFLMDNDKVTTACNNVFYYIVTPSMKARSKPLEVDEGVLEIIREMTKIVHALKAWRGPVVDLLNDNRFFSCHAEVGHKWKPVIKALFDTDKAAFPELLAKISTAPSSNIFTNREYEMLLRSLNVRRLSYALFTGEKNQFLVHLPIIQEKLVDLLKNVMTPIVQSEVYLCIRVLLCRLSSNNLTSFWPVLLTELLRLFEQMMTNLPADGSEDLPLILAVCKFLDLLLVLQIEEFQVHQWIFITDTVDAVYRPNNWFPHAMMDQLAEVISDLPVAESRESFSADELNPTSHPPALYSETRSMRRPMLRSVRQIDSIRDLVPFFSHVSIISYESVYASAGSVDWEAIEGGLMDDMFDAR